MRNLKLNLFLFLIFLLFSCKTENKDNNVIHPLGQKLHDIKGFYFFKQNMSFEDVIKLLKENKIKFKVLNLNNPKEINYPLTWNYVISREDLIRVENIKIIEGYDLPILKSKISRFQICFYENKIFYFNFERLFKGQIAPFYNWYSGDYYIIKPPKSMINTRYIDIAELNDKIKDDLLLLKNLNEGLEFKYGKSNINSGNLNVFIRPNPISKSLSKINNDPWILESEGKLISENRIWIGKDSLIYIKLENQLVSDTTYDGESPVTQIIKNNFSTKIEVMFESKFANEILSYNKMLDKREDSTRKIKKEQINKNKEKMKIQEFNKL